jgi:hypothetical protein
VLAARWIDLSFGHLHAKKELVALFVGVLLAVDGAWLVIACSAPVELLSRVER